MKTNEKNSKFEEYRRYRIEARIAPNIAPHPNRFRVKIKKRQLALLLLKELFHYHGNLKVVKSSPCVYGVFSGPIGGFSPREELCVGCLRCTTQYPQIVQIFRNPERSKLGDSYFTSDQYETVVYEARTGRVPVKGAGYRGKFGGAGWDGIWTDMSEIVRPTRDGIHGREFISTVVDIGGVPPYLEFEPHGKPKNVLHNLTIPIPILFDGHPGSVTSPSLLRILTGTAEQLQTFTIVPLEHIFRNSLHSPSVVPLITSNDLPSLRKLPQEPLMLEMASWDMNLYRKVCSLFPMSLIAVRVQSEEDLLAIYREGIRIFHLAANYHGLTSKGKFIIDLIRDSHNTFVHAQCRDQVTLIGSGGIVGAEHLPKAIICGLDAVLLDTSILAALQAQFIGECAEPNESKFHLPSHMEVEWGIQRLKNLANSWSDQLLEILGAIGLCEVRRLRGEVGRAMWQKEFEDKAFAGITGYE